MNEVNETKSTTATQMPCADSTYQQGLVTEHSISESDFWAMVCKYFNLPVTQLPAPYPISVADMSALIAGYDCNSYAVAFIFSIDPKYHYENVNINAQVITYPTKQLTENLPGSVEYIRSIPLLNGLIANYQGGTFNLYKAINPDTSFPYVTFCVADAAGHNQYYCDISGLYP